MNKLYLNDYLSNLHRQISVSVEKIKHNSGQNKLLNHNEDKKSYYSEYNSLQNYAYNLLDTEVSYQLLNNEINLNTDSLYAASSYKNSSQILKEPTVIMDFMFKNNQNFDFKV